MKQEFNESSNSKRNINSIIKNNNFNDKLNIKKNKIINYLYLILIIIIIIILIILLYLYLSKIKKNKSNINSKNDLNCEDGLFIPEDDQTKCIKCSIENCSKCTGSKLDNNCIKCNPGLNPIYENNKIISCSICNKGYYLINDECRLNYTFKATYKSDGEEVEVKLINNNISEIKEMIVDGVKINPSINYLFNDTQYHEVIMLLDISEDLSFFGVEKMISISFNPYLSTLNIFDMSSMFYYCPSLISVDFGNLDTSKVTNMNFMFYYCSSLK